MRQRRGNRNLYLAGALGALVVGWLFFDFSGEPPREVWVWSTRDGIYPTDKTSLETPYEEPGGGRLQGWIARMDTGDRPNSPGLSLRAAPGLREKVLMEVGIRPAVLDRWFRFRSVAHSAASMQGVFWKLERQD